MHITIVLNGATNHIRISLAFIKKSSLMKRIYLLLFVTGNLLTGCLNPNGSSDKEKLVEFADSLFQANVDSSFIAGASVLIFKNGIKLLDKSYGYASVELSVPMPENSSFEIASVTKQFTAAAILKLVEAGKLSLDDDFTDYLEFDTKGRVITIRNLLNHTSGIASYTEIPEFWDFSTHKYDRDTLVRLIEQKDFLFEPGEAMIYNNSAYFFLGLIIEKITEKSYEEYLNEQFFEPLGMKNTYYCSTLDVIQNKVYGYKYNKNGIQQKEYLDHTWPYAAGSLCSTTEDLLTWMIALHEGKIFDEQLYKLLITPDKLNDGSKLRYAKGLANYTNFGNHLIGHGGWINGFLSDVIYFPEEKLYIICLLNTTGPKRADFFTNELTRRILSKQEYETSEIDVNLESVTGKYIGQAREKILSIQVSSLSESIVISIEDEDDADTLSTYVGNNTWMNENKIIRFTDGECRMDNIYGYYILQKQ